MRFQCYAGTYLALGDDGRSWRISPLLAGWRLEYRDPDHAGWAQAGIHTTLHAAERHASTEEPPTVRTHQRGEAGTSAEHRRADRPRGAGRLFLMP
jgi:hypothetical protein